MVVKINIENIQKKLIPAYFAEEYKSFVMANDRLNSVVIPDDKANEFKKAFLKDISRWLDDEMERGKQW